MKMAITGGTGFVGGRLARTLLADGHDVVVLARGRDPHAGRARRKLRSTTFFTPAARAASTTARVPRTWMAR